MKITFIIKKYSPSQTKALVPISFLKQETPVYKDLNEDSRDSKTIVWLTAFFVPGSSQCNRTSVKWLSFTINETKVRGKIKRLSMWVSMYTSQLYKCPDMQQAQYWSTQPLNRECMVTADSHYHHCQSHHSTATSYGSKTDPQLTRNSSSNIKTIPGWVTMYQNCTETIKKLKLYQFWN